MRRCKLILVCLLVVALLFACGGGGGGGSSSGSNPNTNTDTTNNGTDNGASTTDGQPYKAARNVTYSLNDLDKYFGDSSNDDPVLWKGKAITYTFKGGNTDIDFDGFRGIYDYSAYTVTGNHLADGDYTRLIDQNVCNFDSYGFLDCNQDTDEIHGIMNLNKDLLIYVYTWNNSGTKINQLSTVRGLHSTASFNCSDIDNTTWTILGLGISDADGPMWYHMDLSIPKTTLSDPGTGTDQACMIDTSTSTDSYSYANYMDSLGRNTIPKYVAEDPNDSTSPYTFILDFDIAIKDSWGQFNSTMGSFGIAHINDNNTDDGGTDFSGYMTESKDVILSETIIMDNPSQPFFNNSLQGNGLAIMLKKSSNIKLSDYDGTWYFYSYSMGSSGKHKRGKATIESGAIKFTDTIRSDGTTTLPLDILIQPNADGTFTVNNTGYGAINGNKNMIVLVYTNEDNEIEMMIFVK